MAVKYVEFEAKNIRVGKLKRYIDRLDVGSPDSINAERVSIVLEDGFVKITVDDCEPDWIPIARCKRLKMGAVEKPRGRK